MGLVGSALRAFESANAAPSHPNFISCLRSRRTVQRFRRSDSASGRVLGVLVVQQRSSAASMNGRSILVTLSAQLATSVAHAEAVGSPIVADGAIDLIDDGLF